MSPNNLTAPVRRTTIVVAKLERSLAFYRDLLGMDVYFDGVIGLMGFATRRRRSKPRAGTTDSKPARRSS